MEGKDVAAMARILAPLADSVALVTPDYPRRISAEALAPYFSRGEVVGSVATALADRPRDRVTLVCGSCFLVGEARAHLLGIAFPECGLRTTAR
jgi:folylpolyglutamate synthase/dihydropteroate synthase